VHLVNCHRIQFGGSHILSLVTEVATRALKAMRYQKLNTHRRVRPKGGVEGELYKVAANVAIGRDWAGVHYYSDYYESFKLGEEVALGMLEEKKLQYGETFSMTIPLLDGAVARI